MAIPKAKTYKHFNRFSDINPGKMGRSFWQAHSSDGGGPGGDGKFTLDEAREKLKTDGYMVMKQDAFNRIIDEKHADGIKKGKDLASQEGGGEDLENLKKDNDKLKTQIAELKKDKPDMISKAEHEALLNAKQGEITKRDEQIQGLKNMQKENALLKVIGPKAVDADAVLALTRDKFQIDEDGKVFAINDKGEKAVDSEGYVSIERYYDGFFKEKTYLAKASDSKGAGSSTSEGGGNNPPASGKYTAEQLAAMPMDQYAKVGGMTALAE